VSTTAQPEPTTDPRLRLGRKGDRGRHDRGTVDAILDAGFLCHLGFVHDGHPTVVPTIYGRDADTVYVHGSVASRAMRSDTLDVCLTVTHVDALVLARAAMHHSLNYRSVMVLGEARRVTDRDELLRALEVVTDHAVPGRWAEVRGPTAKELAATAVLALPLDLASAKVRGHGVGDDEEDLGLDVWAGLLPLSVVPGAPIADPALHPDVTLPDHVARWPDR
jgi:nitroimidazol reductase NimA-like FMN-containing flavoprotein (pyridoxamine 5'-phosphate oxidase superfamily)